MSKTETGNFHPIYATAFQNAHAKSDSDLKSLVAQTNEYISHRDDVRKGLEKLEAALNR